VPINLPEMPPRIARLPRDDRGYPIPRFIQWLDNQGRPVSRLALGAEPDFRYSDEHYRVEAYKRGLCWVCGDVMIRHRVFAIGPMCVINRVTMEPACHRECAEYAARACPFMINPREKRNEKNLDPTAGAPGIVVRRNPGVTCLYETREAKPFNVKGGGWLIRLGKPDRVDWWAKGRQATRDEIMESIDTGYPLLHDMALQEGKESVYELGVQREIALKLVPA
jgi:hypothetical protein